MYHITIHRTFFRNTTSRCAKISPSKPFRSFTSQVKHIENKAEILSDIDKSLKRSKPPAIEYIYVNPYWASFPKLDSHSAQNPYGHSAVRYTLPNGEQKVMNIVGLPGSEMVNFLKPEDYIFGAPEETQHLGSEQGGVFKRSFISLRLEELPPANIQAMHEFYVDLKRKSSLEVEKKQAGFSLIYGPINNFIRKVPILRLLFGKTVELGNCAYWTSSGLVKAGVIQKPTMFPKLLFVKLLVNYAWQNIANFNIVSYLCIEKDKPYDGGLVAPFHWISGKVFENLYQFSDVIVKVKNGKAIAKLQTKRLQSIWDAKKEQKPTNSDNK